MNRNASLRPTADTASDKLRRNMTFAPRKHWLLRNVNILDVLGALVAFAVIVRVLA